MKITVLKPIATMALGAFMFFSCATSTDTNENTALDQETYDEADVVGDEADEPIVEEISYDEMFNNVEETENYDILTLAAMEENLSTFVELVQLSGLDTSIEFAEPVTVFIPTDEAFKRMEEERYEYLINPENRAELVRVIRHHILPNKVPKIQFNSSQIIETAGEYEIPIDVEMNGNVVYVGGAEIVKPDIEASNGYIHVVDGVVDPSVFTDVTAD